MPLPETIDAESGTAPSAAGIVLVAGEALTDIIRMGDSVAEHPGGSPANVALGLARLGRPTAFLTALGRDQRGAQIASWLAEAGVEILPESWSLPRTSQAEATIGQDGAAEYDFDIEWGLAAKVQFPPLRHLHIGSISAFLNPGADQIERLVLGIPKHVTVSFDPNVRRDLVGDPVVARARFKRLAERADLIKLSDEDATFLYPDSAPETVVHALAERGRLVALTKGAAGSLIALGSNFVHIEAIQAVVADTVGAGDSYMAALVHQLLERGYPSLQPTSEAELVAAGRFAARAAAITVSRSGAQPPTALEMAAGG